MKQINEIKLRKCRRPGCWIWDTGDGRVHLTSYGGAAHGYYTRDLPVVIPRDAKKVWLVAYREKMGEHSIKVKHGLAHTIRVYCPIWQWSVMHRLGKGYSQFWVRVEYVD